MADADRFSVFKTLYTGCVARVVRWSEGEVLSPEYLHLHEMDIGIETQGYRLGQYIMSFLQSLGPLTRAFARIVFCYSYEETDQAYPACPPSRCKRDSFYWYQIAIPSDREPAYSDITFPGGGVDTNWSEPARLATLRDILAQSDWVQPYMLRQIGPTVDAQFEIHEASREYLGTLEAWHRSDGAYQFSIYGFELRDGRALTTEEALLLNVAFLVHVWTWNHDLRTAHIVRTVVQETLPRAVERWAEFHAGMQTMLDSLRELHIVKDENVDVVIPLTPSAIEHLFIRPHDLSDWAAESFKPFVERVHTLAGGHAARNFLAHCGWPSADVSLGEDANAIMRARATWLALRYLTRCALAETDEYRKASFDQLLLAVLFGLHQGGAPGTPLLVERTVIFHDNTSPGDATLRAEKILGLTTSKSQHNWSQSEWMSELRNVDGRLQVNVRWKSSPPAAVLPAFLSSGMLAMQFTGPSLQVFPLPAQPTTEPNLLPGHILHALARVARALGMQSRKADPKLAVLRGISAELETVVTKDNKRLHRGRLRFYLDKILPDVAFVPAALGELRRPLTRLAELCGARSPIPVDSVESQDWGLFVVKHETASEIVLTLKEGRS